ncbi:MAG: hypothetical protein GY862_27615 [Gammaproteobacteria bacterium]|nr:hypothetical protein [Gammaproteobacteria bacterium]
MYTTYPARAGALRGTSRFMRSALHPFIFPGLPDAKQRGVPNAGFRTNAEA